MDPAQYTTHVDGRAAEFAHRRGSEIDSRTVRTPKTTKIFVKVNPNKRPIVKFKYLISNNWSSLNSYVRG